MRNHMAGRCLCAIITALVSVLPAQAFIEELLGSAFGGGGGGSFQFSMGDGGAFQMGDGGGGRRPKKPKFPKNIQNKIDKDMSWMKGTEWMWNKWRKVKFEKDGNFEAPTKDCSNDRCIWAAKGGTVWIMWGEAGLHELKVEGAIPQQQDNQAMQGMKMKGKRVSDGERCSALFERVFDFEAAELDKDLYAVLGIPDDAEEAEIKKVYRKLSIKYHPDKNPDEVSKKKFAEVRDAYEILNDADKKILYDTGGMEAVKKHEKGEVQKGEDFTQAHTVNLEDLYNGELIKAALNRRVVCRGCRIRPDSPKCQGCSKCPNEQKTVHVQVGPGMYMQQNQEVPSKEKCKNENTDIDVQVEKGMRDGEKLSFPRMAAQKPGVIPGNVIFALKAKPHPKFTRQGDDLHMKAKISLREALLGWTRTVRHLDKHTVEVSAKGVTKPFQVIEVKGEGMPLRDDPASFGNMFVRVEVVFPKTITKAQADALGNIFEQDPPAAEL